MKNILIASCLCLAASLGATTFSVSNLNDSGAGSLRQAITDAEAAAGADDIEFGATLNGTLNLLTALPDITQSLTIQGPTLPTSTVVVARAPTAATNFRIFTITAGTVSITDLTLFQGNVTGTPATGGGISNAGTLTMARCVVMECMATGDAAPAGLVPALGGGIYSTGALTLTDCEIMDCEAHGGMATTAGTGGVATGGGIYQGGGLLTLVRCLIEHCHANGGEGMPATHGTGSASAVFVGGGGANIRDSDMHGCESRSHHAPNALGVSLILGGPSLVLRSSICESVGGGVEVLGSATLRNLTASSNMGGDTGGVRVNSPMSVVIEYCTVTANSGTVGGIDAVSGTPGVEGCIVAGNTGTDPDVSGAMIDGGFNLIGDTTGSASFTTSTLVGTSFSPVSAGLGPLQSFGDTQGHEPVFGSFAINNGGAGAPFDDQRGANRALGGVADIGSIEFLVNNAPSFNAGGGVSVSGDGSQTVAGWATNIFAGAPWESGQALNFVFVGPNGSFRNGPAIDPVTGDLTFRPDDGASGSFVFDVYLVDDGGTAGGGSDTSPASVLVISVNNNDDDNDDICSTAVGGTPWLLLLALAATLMLATRMQRNRA